MEGTIFEDLDLFVIGGNQAFYAFTISVPKLVDDGFVSIKATDQVDMAKISGIEIKLMEVHTAHAVALGPVRSFIIFLAAVDMI